MSNGFGNGTGYGPSAMEYAVAEKRTQIGADWFFWIAGLSLVSSVAILAGYNYHSVVGLGTAETISDIAAKSGTPGQNSGKLFAFLFDLLASGFYVLYGFFGRKGAKWAFLTGMAFYALDAALLLVGNALGLLSGSIWLSAAFHAYALFRIFQGFQAAQQLGVMRMQQGALGGASSLPPSSATPSGDVWPPPPSV